MLCHWSRRIALAIGFLSLGPVQAAPRPAPAAVQVSEVASGLSHPWALAFLPDGSALITERPGSLRLWRGGRLSPPIPGLPKVYAESQGGLLDVALSPGFAQDRLVYLAYAEAGDGKSGTAVGRGRLSEDGTTLADFTVIFRQVPKLSRGQHYGARLAFDRQGYLFVSLGENNDRPTAQDLDKLQGKIVRLRADGTVPGDNPFHGDKRVRPEIWSYGHRNPQGLAFNPWSGALWEHEHGPRGGDEVNIIQRGANYGWPLATHGINYSGLKIPEAKGTKLAGGAEPLYWWEKSPAVSGMAFYDAQAYPQWKHSLFIGALADQALIRLTLEGDKVAAEERLLKDRGARIRDVRVGPDGAVYVLTDAPQGALLRVTPGEAK
ncbi:exported dehydrogenase [Bordetella hinzii]|uniref:PQQ-dependent sugar dehydrogenase n=1 Tax=Bordetella hinzii TaxID=103855 RepID=UPI00040F24E3|nr:PQQ-dependent sugar dehydrogenase [Bordetella hinzii]AKQ55598.1 Soluble aldose sugar dehydrogenase YliI precursor [Bordetella hinzii]KCB26730.1 soluble aldose sugar dehydrogenase YliI [Bordetella hinzii CA90 BAL1384]KCB32841.1 soluble aldose sugar dehydrogenase YliI [Bordetella hinzii L60]KCB50965.1 soluble aldose sugar dehydrogenase YliI [Bordetella hinzii 1277]WPL80577.1 PQQ-dependent sugar dehydrogenase [Bordetella hinzii]